MKIKSLIALALIGSLSLGALSAKDNPKAATYRTHETADKSAPAVYFIREITPEALVKVYKATGYSANGKTGVKVSTGESENSNYLRPALIKNLVKDELNATIVECNTAYGGGRSNNIDHLRIAREHGFLDVAAGFDLQDADGYMAIPVKGGERLKENYVGSHFKDYDTYLILSHFKGHAMAGFGGAIKNISIGFASGMSVEKSGKDAVSLEPGMVIVIPANVKHWHGAKKDSWFSHITFEPTGENTSNEWLEPVPNEMYEALGE